MKQRDPQFIEDVESLLEDAVLEEATALVWQAFETALNKLDPESLGLLREHFDGLTADEISKKHGIPKDQVSAWLSKTKREVLEEIRRESPVRQ